MIVSFIRWWLVFVTVFGCVDTAPVGNRLPVRDASRLRPPVRPPVRPAVDASVPRIRGFTEDWRDEVTREYLKLFRPGSRQAWLAAVNRCIEPDGHGGLRFIAPIRDAARIMRGRYPVAFVAGLVIHESWCRANYISRDGGTGYAQITPPRGRKQVDRRWLDRAKEYLGHDPDWRGNPTENIVLGLAVLMEAEIEFGSRELGLAAYNAGIGGVKRAMRQLGWRSGQPPLSLNRVGPLLPHRPHHWDARWYAAKVLATTVLANRTTHGRRDIAVINSRRFRLEHIPGAIPDE